MNIVQVTEKFVIPFCSTTVLLYVAQKQVIQTTHRILLILTHFCGMVLRIRILL